MPGNAEVRRINCTQCAAPLELHGGHKVQGIVCSYCGSLLDAGEGHQVLKAHYVEQGKRAYLPLQTGDEGTLQDVDVTVIGFISYSAQESAWTEFCLFSPPHGYVWLSWEQNHFVFVRRLRDIPVPSSSWRIFNPRQKIHLGSTKFAFYEAYTAEVVDVGGELPWRGEIGERVDTADAVAPPRILSQESEEGEIAYYVGEYLSSNQVAEAFGKPAIERAGKHRTVHPAQPFVASAFERQVQLSGRVFTALAIVGLLYILISGSGEILLQKKLPWQEVQDQDGALTQSFKVTQPNRLVKVTLDGQVSNAWLWLDLDISRQGEDVGSFGKEISFYEGYEDGERWTEGSQRATAIFRVPGAGDYELNVKVSERGGAQYQGPIYVVVEQGILLKRWFLILAILLVPAAFWIPLRKAIFEHRRWSPVTSDEDDD